MPNTLLILILVVILMGVLLILVETKQASGPVRLFVRVAFVIASILLVLALFDQMGIHIPISPRLFREG